MFAWGCLLLLLQVSVFINMFVTCVFAAGFYGERPAIHLQQQQQGSS